MQWSHKRHLFLAGKVKELATEKYKITEILLSLSVKNIYLYTMLMEKVGKLPYSLLGHLCIWRGMIGTWGKFTLIWTEII